MELRELWRDGRTKDPDVRRAANACLHAWEGEHGETLEAVSRSGAGTLFRSRRFLLLGRTSRLESLERNPGLIHWSAISATQFEKLKRSAKQEQRALTFLLLSHDTQATRYFEVPGEAVEWHRLPKRPSGGAYLKITEARGRSFLEMADGALDVSPFERQVSHRGSGPDFVTAPSYAGIVTIDPRVRSGKACIRGLRITVQDVLEYLAAGMSEPEILEDFPDLTREDIRACLAYAADRERRLRGAAI